MASTNGHGGKRPGAGRPKGSRNKQRQVWRAELRKEARKRVPAALAVLDEVLANSEARPADRLKAAGLVYRLGCGQTPGKGRRLRKATRTGPMQREGPVLRPCAPASTSPRKRSTKGARTRCPSLSVTVDLALGGDCANLLSVCGEYVRLLIS